MIAQEQACRPVALLNALMAGGAREEQVGPPWMRYLDPIAELSAGLPAPFLGAFVLIWQLRSTDLGRQYSLATVQSRLDFLAWCVVHGRREYALLREASPFWAALAKPAEFTGAILAPDDPGRGISVLMCLVHRFRTDLDWDLTTFQGRRDFLVWYFLHGRAEMGLEELPTPPWQRRILEEDALQGLSRLQHWVYRARSDLQEAFPLPAASAEYIQWFSQVPPIKVESERLGAAPAASPLKSFGVNVIGYAYGQLGIGEDARMATKALLTTAVPVTMFNFPPGKDVPQGDFSMEQWVAGELPYAVNMFCLTALEQARFVAENGLKYLTGFHNVGYWPWELARWPDEWRHLFALVDEVWVSTQHTFDAVCPVAPVPVRCMPMAVEASGASGKTRADFGLPTHDKLFLFAFDLKSSVGRKNPKACIAAFLSAFPQSEEEGAAGVGLVIKVHPPKGMNEEWEGLKKLRNADQRIHFVEETLSRADLLALYRCCDSFVSLHRAEGFGRSIAEVMLLGRPVIVTAYSGNMDFNSETNSLLVDYELISLEKDDYPFGDGQVWAEPDIQDAADQMRKVVFAPDTVFQLAMRGKIVVEEFNSFAKVGQRYVNLLNDVRMRVNAIDCV